MNLARVSLLFPVVALALGGASCKREAPQEAVQPAADTATASAALDTHFAKVTQRKLPPTLEASGSLTADQISEVASAASGVVVDVAVDVGTQVKKGDVLVRLDPRNPSLQVSAASATVEQAKARLGIKPGEKFDPNTVTDVRVAKEAMDLAVTDADRTKALFDGGSVSQAAWDQARSRAEQARAQYDAALNGARQAWATLLAAESQTGIAQKALADTAIRAPFDGAVAEKRINVGEFATMGKVVAVVVQNNPLRLKMDIPETDAGKIDVGKEVLVTVSTNPGRVFKGTIKRISASLKTSNRALPVEAEIKNDDGALKPGSFARAQIDIGGTEEKTLFIPAKAIGNTGSASRVFVRSGNRVVERIVTIGRELDGLVEVKGSITDADEVAIDQVDKLSDGAEVKAVN